MGSGGGARRLNDPPPLGVRWFRLKKGPGRQAARWAPKSDTPPFRDCVSHGPTSGGGVDPPPGRLAAGNWTRTRERHRLPMSGVFRGSGGR